jgi:hypothetical protein
MYYVQQRPELIVPTVVFSALARLYQKTGDEIDPVSFDDISCSDLLVESMDCSQTFGFVQDVNLAFEQDNQNYRGDFGAKKPTVGLIVSYLGANISACSTKRTELRMS